MIGRERFDLGFDLEEFLDERMLGGSVFVWEFDLRVLLDSN